MAKYVRICKTVNTKGALILEADIQKNISNPEIDHYSSTYYYNDSHFEVFKKLGSIAGIKDVKSNKVWWDFDGETLEGPKNDVLELLKRLQAAKIPPEAVELWFSGNKGFNAILNVNQELTPKQIRHIAVEKFGQGLSTLDPSLYDAPQLLRIPGTKHQVSGLYKIPITIKQLENFKVDKLKEKAAKKPIIDLKVNKIDLAPELLIVPEEKAPVTPTNDLDLYSKPRQWKSSKWALMQGFIKPGERNQSAMILSATCKAMGYDLLTTYYMCKSALKKSWERYGEGNFDKKELFSIIERTFEKDNIGQYSEKDDPFLQKKAEELGIKELTTQNTVDIKGALRIYKDYAKNINKLTLKTGIKEIDERQRITVGMSFGIIAAPGVGKCLGKGTPILMFDGSIKNVEEIKVGDKIMGDDSKVRNILSICQGKEQLYKIHQNNGNSYVVNESHILSLKGGATFNPNKRLKKYEYGRIHDIELKDYLNGSKKEHKYLKGYKVPIEFKKQNTPLDPYLFGLWLGDGTSTKPEITIGKQDIELMSYLKKSAEEMILSYNIVQDRKCYRFNFKKVKRTHGKNLVARNIPENKVIPQEYLINSKENRLKLLAGLIDSDGYYSPKKGYYEITQKNNKLSEQIVYLCRSLGFRTTITKSEKYCYYKGEKKTGIYNRVIFTAEDLTEIPTKLQRKQAVKIIKQRYHDLTKIKVEKLEVGDYYGFEIDGNKRFLLGDFTVTHNTSIALEMLYNMSKSGELCIFFSYDMYAPLIIQKIIQKHWKDGDIEQVFREYENGNQEYVEKVEELIKVEYPNVEFCFESAQNIEEIYHTIHMAEQKKGKKCKFVVIDYNELVITDLSDPTQSSNFVAQKVRELASKEQLCVLSLFQPSKLTGDPSTEILSFRAAKGGSGIEQSVSLMFGISRPGFDPRKPADDKYISINCVKNRMGPIFSADLYWNGYQGTVRSLSPEEKSELRFLRQRKEDERLGRKPGIDEGWESN